MFDMVKGHYLQLSCYCLLFCTFKWFNINATSAYYPVIQRDVDKLLDKDANEPCANGAGFYSTVFMVLKLTDGL